MTWVVDSSGSETAKIPFALTSISNASPAVFTLTAHGLTTGDAIVLTTTGGLPTGLALLTIYYVIAAGLTANAFEVSATIGGSAINTSSAGSGTHTITAEQVLAAPTTNATHVLAVDMVNLVLGDLVELRCYDMIDGSNYRQVWKGTYQHVQMNVGKFSPPLPVTTQAKFTLKQTAGTGRVFPWSLRRI